MHGFLNRVAALGGVAVLAGSSLAPCAGWESTPEARNACCESHGCQHASEETGVQDQSDRDRCCARSERGTPSPSDAPTPQAMALTAIHGPDAFAPTAALSTDLRHRDRPHPPGSTARHVLLSVFLV